MSQSHEVPKLHKALNLCNIFLVNLSVLEPSWQKELFENTQFRHSPYFKAM